VSLVLRNRVGYNDPLPRKTLNLFVSLSARGEILIDPAGVVVLGCIESTFSTAVYVVNPPLAALMLSVAGHALQAHDVDVARTPREPPLMDGEHKIRLM
jgi:hypothetical protein